MVFMLFRAHKRGFLCSHSQGVRGGNPVCLHEYGLQCFYALPLRVTDAYNSNVLFFFSGPSYSLCVFFSSSVPNTLLTLMSPRGSSDALSRAAGLFILLAGIFPSPPGLAVAASTADRT